MDGGYEMSDRSADEPVKDFKEPRVSFIADHTEELARLIDKTLNYADRLKTMKLVSISVALALSAALMSFVTSKFVGLDMNRSILSGLVTNFEPEKFATIDQVNDLKASNAKIQEALTAALDTIAKSGGGDAAQAFELSSLKASVTLVDQRLAVIERSISESPEKALSIPLLRKDQETLAKEIDTGRAAVSIELARIYDQQKWMLGGVGTVLVAVVAALFTALFKIIFKPKDD